MQSIVGNGFIIQPHELSIRQVGIAEYRKLSLKFHLWYNVRTKFNEKPCSHYVVIMCTECYYGKS